MTPRESSHIGKQKGDEDMADLGEDDNGDAERTQASYAEHAFQFSLFEDVCDLYF